MSTVHIHRLGDSTVEERALPQQLVLTSRPSAPSVQSRSIRSQIAFSLMVGVFILALCLLGLGCYYVVDSTPEEHPGLIVSTASIGLPLEEQSNPSLTTPLFPPIQQLQNTKEQPPKNIPAREIPVSLQIPTPLTALTNEVQETLEELTKIKNREAEQHEELLQRLEKQASRSRSENQDQIRKPKESSLKGEKSQPSQQVRERDQDRTTASFSNSFKTPPHSRSSQNSDLSKKIVTVPSLIKQVKAKYPRSARRERLEGVTHIAIKVTPEGKVSSPSIKKSSGHRVLDFAALAAVKKWRFKPARNGLGHAVPHSVTLPFTFQLK